MPSIFAKTALLPSGWCDDVVLTIGADGKISSVESRVSGQVKADHHVSLLLPALANVHSHAFQRAMAGLTEHRSSKTTDNFWSWRERMYQFVERLTPEQVEAIAALVQMEMLESGYASVAEFHYVHHGAAGRPYDNPAELGERIASAAATTGIGLMLLPVLYEYGGIDRRPLLGGQLRFGCQLDQYLKLYEHSAKAVEELAPDCGIGVAAHSLRAVGAEDLFSLVGQFDSVPIHMHLAEQTAEVDELVDATGLRPVEWLLQNVAVDSRWCLIHCTQMTPAETKALANTGAVAGLCPITESNLGDGIFDGLRWTAEGGYMAIGSDSNVRISLSEEIRVLDYSQRLRDRCRVPFATTDQSSGRFLFSAVLAGGAQALQRPTGSLEVGNYADLVSLETDNHFLGNLSGDEWIEGFVFAADDTLVSDVWSAGRHVVQGGRHVQREQIVAAYRVAQKQLMDGSRD